MRVNDYVYRSLLAALPCWRWYSRSNSMPRAPMVAVHRRRAGLTQEQLAEAASISVDMISKIETGATGARFPVIERIAAALRVDPAELFTTEFRSGSLRSPAFTDLSIKLAALNDADLGWIKGVVEAALGQRK